MKSLHKKRLGKSRSPAKHIHGKKRKRYESKRFRRLYAVPRLAVGE